MPQIYDMGPTALLPLRRKACWGFFRPKNPTTSAGFEPANLGTKGQHATPRPPKPWYIIHYTNLLYSAFLTTPVDLFKTSSSSLSNMLFSWSHVVFNVHVFCSSIEYRPSSLTERLSLLAHTHPHLWKCGSEVKYNMILAYCCWWCTFILWHDTTQLDGEVLVVWRKLLPLCSV